MKDFIVIHHHPCRDGFAAAHAAWRWFRDNGLLERVDFLPYQYGDDPPDQEALADKRVYIVDFSFSREVLVRMSTATKSLVVLDHHKTAEEALQGLGNDGSFFVHFDQDHSGAILAWRFFHGDELPPWFYPYVEDRDLWRFRLPHSRELNEAIAIWPQDHELWDRYGAQPMDLHRVAGAALLDAKDHYVEGHRDFAIIGKWMGYPDIPVLNTTHAISDTIGALAEDHLFAVGWFMRADRQYQYSLRSRGDFDVSELCKKLGGGGHKNASGFSSSKLILPS